MLGFGVTGPCFELSNNVLTPLVFISHDNSATTANFLS